MVAAASNSAMEAFRNFWPTWDRVRRRSTASTVFLMMAITSRVIVAGVLGSSRITTRELTTALRRSGVRRQLPSGVGKSVFLARPFVLELDGTGPLSVVCWSEMVGEG